MSKWTIMSLAIIAAFNSAPARAVPITLSCSLVSSSDEANLITDVNQVVLDMAANTVDLRIAQTMGTSNPTNWLFQSRTDTLGTDTFTIKRSGRHTVGAGLYGSAAHSFVLSDTGDLTWVFLWEGTATTFQWRCRK